MLADCGTMSESDLALWNSCQYWCQSYKTLFFFVTDAATHNKLECLSLACFFKACLIFVGKAWVREPLMKGRAQYS
jgi:hypothetical protein